MPSTVATAYALRGPNTISLSARRALGIGPQPRQVGHDRPHRLLQVAVDRQDRFDQQDQAVFHRIPVVVSWTADKNTRRDRHSLFCHLRPRTGTDPGRRAARPRGPATLRAGRGGVAFAGGKALVVRGQPLAANGGSRPSAGVGRPGHVAGRVVRRRPDDRLGGIPDAGAHAGRRLQRPRLAYHPFAVRRPQGQGRDLRPVRRPPRPPAERGYRAADGRTEPAHLPGPGDPEPG